MHRNEVRRISDGGMMVALIGVILFLNRQSAGLLESIFYWVLSFPILIYTCRYGLKWGCIVSVAMMVLSFILSTPTTMFYLFSSLVIGVIYGEGVRRRWPNGWLLAMTFLFTFFSYVITMFVFAEIFGYNIEVEILELSSMFGKMMEYSDTSLVIELRHAILIVIVISNILSAVLQSICVHLVSFILLKRLKFEINPVKTVFDLKLSRFWGCLWIVVLLGCWLMIPLMSSEGLKIALLSVAMCVMLLLIGYGLSVVMCMLRVSRFKAVVITMALALIPLAWPFLIGLAFVDSWIDIKGRKRGEYYGSIRKL